MSFNSISAQIDGWSAMLKDFDPPPKTAKGFLKVAGRGNLENVTSNLLAFFLNPDEDHGMGSVILESLLELICHDVNSTDYKPGEVSVRREVCCTPSVDKLDILVSLKGHLIGVENKVDAGVYNNLAEYGRFVDEQAEAENKTPVKALLTLKPVKQMPSDMGGFQHVRYSALFKGIRLRISSGCAASKYLTILEDFMETLEQEEQGPQVDPKFIKFIKQDEQKLFDLYSALSRFGDHLETQVAAVRDLLITEFKLPSPYRGYADDDDEKTLYVSLDCKVEVEPGVKIALAFCLSPIGWEIYSYPWAASPAAERWCRKLTSDDGSFAQFAFTELPQVVARKFQELLDKAALEIKRGNTRRR
jgi:hypothetical protein